MKMDNDYIAEVSTAPVNESPFRIPDGSKQ